MNTNQRLKSIKIIKKRYESKSTYISSLITLYFIIPRRKGLIHLQHVRLSSNFLEIMTLEALAVRTLSMKDDPVLTG